MNKHYLKIVAIISFTFSTVALLSLSKSIVEGYESSIYTGIPIIFFILMLSSNIGSSYLILEQKTPNTILWKVGYFNILFNNAVLVILPALRGYAFHERTDVLTHIGYVMDINSTNFFTSDNFYPLMHIILSELSQIANLQVIDIFRYSPAMIYIILMLNIYFLIKSIFTDYNLISVAVVLSSLLFLGRYHTVTVPNGVADIIFPLVIALYFKNLKTTSLKFKIPFILITIIFPFLHPLTSVAVIVMFIYIELSKFVLSNPIYSLKININPIILLGVAFLTWISSYVVWSQSVQSIFSRLTGEIKSTPLNTMASDLQKVNIQSFDFLELFIRMYGVAIFYIGLSFIAIYYLIKNYNKSGKFEYNISMISICLLLFLLFLSIMLFVPLGFSALRLLTYVVLISLIVGSYGLFQLNNVKIKRVPILLLLLIFPSIIGVFNIYDSPLVIKPNSQITSAEFEGWKWFINCKEESTQVIGIMSVQPYRFIDAICGVSDRLHRNDIGLWAPILPDHFNYTVRDSIGDSFSNSIYIPLSKYDKDVYTDAWKIVGRYNESDFKMLENDKSALKLYSNKDFDLWYVV